MVYEYGYEYGLKKRNDQRTESHTEGSIQYLVLPLCSMAAAPSVCYALCK